MKNKKFLFTDILLIICACIPLIVAMVLKVLFTPASDGINITGALVYFTIPMPIQDLPISEAQVNAWLVIITIFFICLFITHGVKEKPDSIRQHLAEWIVETTEKMVKTNMGDFFEGFAPFIAAIMGLSAFSSLMSLIGVFPPTSDFNIIAGWSITVFILITFYKLKCGPVEYIKSFFEPVPFLAPLNVISELANPLSMTFRHYGNVLSGTVISVLVASALQGLTNLLLGWLPGALGQIPFLQIGIPAVLSIYFDVFSSCLQAFIFAMLTMIYISGGFPAEKYFARQKKKERKI